MAWSIFQQGGGDGAAVTWAKDLLAADHAPDTPATEQFIYDWEKSEGGGGKYNPLNQGPVPGHSELTTTGSQYGGGAADYASYQAGIQGAVDFLNMPNYTAVQAALKQGNAVAARQALIQSPWAASHYGYGSAFSNAALPGQSSALLGDASGGSSGNGSGAQSAANVVPASLTSMLGGAFGDALGSLFGLPFGALSPTDIVNGLKNWLVRGALIVLGGTILIIGVIRLSGTDKKALAIVTGGSSGEKKKGEKNAADKERSEDKSGDGEGIREEEG